MQFQSSSAKFEAGCDEAGRGCLAGPVVAAAVILPEGFQHEWLNDSKQVPKNKRNELRKIIEDQALAETIDCVDKLQKCGEGYICYIPENDILMIAEYEGDII